MSAKGDIRFPAAYKDVTCLKICTEMAEAQFSRQKNRWSTFRYSIIMGIGMGWSLIYKQSSAISLFHTKLIIWASYWTKTVTRRRSFRVECPMSERALEYSWITRKDRKAKCALHVNEDSVVSILSRVECLWKSGVGVLADFTRKGRRRRYFWEADSCCSVIDKEGRRKHNKKQTRKEDEEKEKLLSEERFT